MRLIFVGAPGAGKGTQAVKIARHFGIAHVSTGDMFRAAIQNGSTLGQQVAQLIAAGSLVPDDITVAMVVDRLLQADCQQGFLLDGFPRTRPQAEVLELALNEAGTRLDGVVLIDVPDDLIVERICGRRLDPETGHVYHIHFNPPPAEVADRVVQRSDDTEETCRRRLASYHGETESILPYYERRGVLVRVNGTRELDEVTANIIDAISSLKP